MSNITSLGLEAPKPNMWAVVVGADNIPCVYKIGDYTLTPDRMLFLWKSTNKDEYPLTITNMAHSGSVDFTEEEPKMMTLEDFNNDVEVVEEENDGSI